MGNQLAGIAPSQILSVDSYFSDIPEYEYDRSLGSTRFFKVARVFAIQVRLTHMQRAEELKIRLHYLPTTASPIHKASAHRERADHVITGHTVARTSSTDQHQVLRSRPFLNNREKRWLAFPDLGAVEAEPPPARHGDIKSGGTSWDFVWNWDSRIRQLQTHDFWPEDIPQNFKLTSSTTSRRPLLHRPREVGLTLSPSSQPPPLGLGHNVPSSPQAPPPGPWSNLSLLPRLLHWLLPPGPGLSVPPPARLLPLRLGLNLVPLLPRLLPRLLPWLLPPGLAGGAGPAVVVSLVTSCLQTLSSCDSKLAGGPGPETGSSSWAYHPDPRLAMVTRPPRNDTNIYRSNPARHRRPGPGTSQHREAGYAGEEGEVQPTQVRRGEFSLTQVRRGRVQVQAHTGGGGESSVYTGGGGESFQSIQGRRGKFSLYREEGRVQAYTGWRRGRVSSYRVRRGIVQPNNGGGGESSAYTGERGDSAHTGEGGRVQSIQGEEGEFSLYRGRRGRVSSIRGGRGKFSLYRGEGRVSGLYRGRRGEFSSHYRGEGRFSLTGEEGRVQSIQGGEGRVQPHTGEVGGEFSLYRGRRGRVQSYRGGR
uniref:Uncharacterized protein n=1 Tax=Neogobius melanostomus TaxID=47308 RepID=A0A8C6WPF6_9GOBI